MVDYHLQSIYQDRAGELAAITLPLWKKNICTPQYDHIDSSVPSYVN